MKISRFITLSFAMLAFAGCSSMGLESKRVDYKSDSVSVPSLEVPPDLTVPSAEDHYTVPGGSGAASYSEYAREGTGSQASVVLPVSRNVRLMHDGAKRWLRVDDRAENIWPVVKTFWQENGFSILTDNPQAGVIETDWAENRAKIPRTGLRSLLGKVVDGLYDSGEKDRYVVRMERSQDGASTDVHLTMYGKEEVLSNDKSTSVWQSRPNDPEVEATMLQMLMAKLAGSEKQAQAGGNGVEATPTSSASAAPRIPMAPKLETLGDGSRGILLNTSFDRGWQTVGMAIERIGYVIKDKDRSSGIYFLLTRDKIKEKSWVDKLAFWSSDKPPVPTQVSVREVEGGCEVTANDGTGASNEETKKIIDALYKALGG